MENPASKGASMASVQDSTGVDQDRGMCEEKRTNEPISYSRHLELGNGSAADIESRRGAPRGVSAANQTRDVYLRKSKDDQGPMAINPKKTSSDNPGVRPAHSSQRR